MYVAALLVLVTTTQSAEVNPIGKVLQMISDLEAKVMDEGEKAQKLYSEFAEFCEDKSRDLGFSIKTNKGEIANLKATIEEMTATIGATTSKIDDLSSSISTDEADLKAATGIREKEVLDFDRGGVEFLIQEKGIYYFVSEEQGFLLVVDTEARDKNSFLVSREFECLDCE